MKRYEYKLSFPLNDYEEVVRRLLSSAYFFREIYHERTIHNVYFDTVDFHDYKANIDGHDERSKFRLRWYGSDHEFMPTLEEKIKIGEVGYKKSIPHTSKMTLNDLKSYKASVHLENMDQGLRFKERHPVLINQYQRRYFEASNQKVRITLDRKLQFKAFSSAFSPDAYGLNVGVLEIKCSVEDKLEILELIQSLHLRLDKFSKYVTGIQLVYQVQ